MSVIPRRQRTIAVSASHAARLLNCDMKTVIAMIEDGRLRGYQDRPGGWWKIDYSSVLEYRQKIEAAFDSAKPDTQPA
jgi:excisionase family DNA binding protein